MRRFGFLGLLAGPLLLVGCGGGNTGGDPTPQCVQPPQGMAAWWPLDEQSGSTASDMAGSVANDGQNSGASPTAGRVNGAYRFNGSTSYVQVPDHPELNVGTGDFTLDAWVRTSASGLMVLVDKRSGPTPKGYSLYIVDGRLGFQMANGSGSATCAPTPRPGVACANYVAPSSGPLVNDGQWHHVAAVVDRSDPQNGVRLYVDGSQVFSGPPMVSDDLDNPSDLYLGVRTPGTGSGAWLNGELDEVELFKRALSAGEIKALFAAGPAGKCKCARENRTLILNTGYDQAQGSLIPAKDLDYEWYVTAVPSTDPNQTVPRPAHAVSAFTGVGNPPGGSWSSAYPNSQWISINPTAQAPSSPNPPTPITYQYTYYFTLPPGATNIQLNLKVSADDEAKVYLNGTLLGSGGNLFQTPLNVTASGPFNTGSTINKLVIEVNDTYRQLTGFIAEGQVTYQDCCRRPVRLTPGLAKVRFHEVTGSVSAKDFAANAPEILSRLSSLTSSSNDFSGAPTELYDVFYSDWDGTPNPNGRFLTVEAVYDQELPRGGGLNIARVDLLDPNGSIIASANSVVSFAALGNNAIPQDVVKAVDGNLSTYTTMGNTVNQGSRRLRITLGFPCP